MWLLFALLGCGVSPECCADPDACRTVSERLRAENERGACPETGDTGREDTGREDTGGGSETGGGEDTARPDDSADSGVDDSGVGDTASADTAEDTAAVDTGGAGETGMGDTARPDILADGVVDLETEADAKRIGEAELRFPAELSLAADGDLDGDGVADLLVGYVDEGFGDGHGAVYVVHGAPRGDASLGASDVILRGSGGEEAGYSVASGGDLDGDGADDLVVGAPERGNEGRVYILRGPLSSGDTFGGATGVLDGEYFDSEYGYFGDAGERVASNGDADGDGLSDVLVGAPSAELLRGAAYVVPGPATGTFALADASNVVGEPGANLGGSVAYAGDTDGDGLDDIAIGQRNASTVALLFLGPWSEERTPADADVAIEHSARFATAAHALTGAGDVDGDGLADVVLEWVYDGEGGDDAGAAFLFRGPLRSGDLLAADAKLVGAAAGDRAGRDLCAGDIDGDGRSDLAVGAMIAGTGFAGPGAVFLTFGPASGTVSLGDAPVRFDGGAGDWAGHALACGDLDGDDHADLVVSGPADEDGGRYAGAVWVVYAASLLPE